MPEWIDLVVLLVLVLALIVVPAVIVWWAQREKLTEAQRLASEMVIELLRSEPENWRRETRRYYPGGVYAHPAAGLLVFPGVVCALEIEGTGRMDLSERVNRQLRALDQQLAEQAQLEVLRGLTTELNSRQAD